MRIEFTIYAKYELLDAIDFYNYKSEGLGDRFREEVYKGLTRINEYPDAWEKQTLTTHRYVIDKFPYKIIYRIKNNIIYIIAIACSHRKPEYWIDRNNDLLD